jgi:DNA-binding CsgD family transcriptional regulator
LEVHASFIYNRPLNALEIDVLGSTAGGRPGKFEERAISGVLLCFKGDVTDQEVMPGRMLVEKSGITLERRMPDVAKKKSIIDLSADERAQLLQRLRRSKHSARKVTRARVLLEAADGLTDDQIAAALDCGVATVERTRKGLSRQAWARLMSIPARVPGQHSQANTQHT